MNIINSHSAFYYSHAATELLEQAKLLYDISTDSKANLLSLKKNAIFLIEDRQNGRYFILRINRPGFYTLREIEAEISWIRELSKCQKSIVISEPVSGMNGEFVQKLSSDSKNCYCVLFTFLRGQPLNDNNNADELIKNFAKLGEAAAVLHQNAIQWDHAHSLNRGIWNCSALIGRNARFGSYTHETGIAMTGKYLNLFERASVVINDRLAKFGRSPARFGLIHANLTPSNILVYKNKLAITDFDECGFGWYLYDLACSLSCFESEDEIGRLIEAWLEGYSRCRHISNEEKAEIPTFIMMRRLSLLGRLASEFDSTPSIALSSDYIEGTALLARKYLADFE